jgi:hypothetical protein
MSFQILEEPGGRNLRINVRGKLAKGDYRQFVQNFEQHFRQYGKFSVLFDMTGFHGWKAGALWDEIKFDSTHYVDIDRLAMVGDTKWERDLEQFCELFTRTPIQYFNQADLADARTWLNDKQI